MTWLGLRSFPFFRPESLRLNKQLDKDFRDLHIQLIRRKKRIITVAHQSDITTMLSDIKELIEPDNQWEKLQSIGMIESVRIVKEKTTIETRYYISILPNNAQNLGESVRSRGIENSLQWVLYVGFREDNCLIIKDNAPQNFAFLRHISLNLLNQEKTSKAGAKNKRFRADRDDDYLTKFLAVAVN
ncbi:ISAs1 family transposase [Microcoleus sp. F6_B4]